PGQTLLADWDPNDHSVEILGQIVHVKYTSATGKIVESDAEVGKDRTWIDAALHILRQTPGDDTSAVVTTALATENMQKWFRRIYAQIGMAPRLVQPARYVDAPENLISISDNTGADAAGATNGISFRLRVKAAGKADAVYNIGPHKQRRGDVTLV